MKKSVAGACVALAISTIALTGCKPEVFANCTAMNAKYKGGVGVPGAVDKRTGGGHAKYVPKWDKALYDANAKSDRDKDKIACEQ
ncbi:hypothetical protein BH10ACT1_BH10ACT1_01910 [soil metagenome]